MTDTWRQRIEQALETLSPPHLDCGLVSANCLESLVLEGDVTRLRLVLGYPAAGLAEVAKKAGACVAEINPNPTPHAMNFDHAIAGKAGTVLPELVSNRAFP